METTLEEKKSDTCIKIANTFCLLATTVIIFFIYLSLNDKLSDVDELTNLASEFFRLSNNYMVETKKTEQSASTHKIGIYMWIWGLLFVLSFFSYMVDWYQFQGLLRWSLILFFMFLKAGLIMAFFMHLFWERYALVNVLLWPMTAIACFIFLMVAEFEYTVFSRLFYFVVGGAG